MNEGLTENNKIPYNILILSFLAAIIPLVFKYIFVPTYPGSDDAFIHLAIAKNIVNSGIWGTGLKSVNMSTSPVFTLLIAGLKILGLDLISTGKLLSALFSTAGLFLIFLIIFKITKNPFLSLFIQLFCAFNFHLLRWTGTVMETTMAFFMVCLILYINTSRSSLLLHFIQGLLIGLAVLIRFEIILVAILINLQFIIIDKVKFWKKTIPVVAGILLVLSPWLIFAYSYFGSIVPSTFYAKTSSGINIINAGFLRQFIVVSITSYTFPVIIFIFLFFLFLMRNRVFVFRIIREHLVILFFPVMLFLFYYLKTTGLQSAGRYLLPSSMCLPIILGILLNEAFKMKNSRLIRFGFIVSLIVHIGITAGMFFFIAMPILSNFKDNYWKTMIEVSDALNNYSHDHGKKIHVLVEIDIGVLSYENKGNYVIHDGGALASPELGRLNIKEQSYLVQPDLLVEVNSESKFKLAFYYSFLDPVTSWKYKSPSIENPFKDYYCNIYKLK